MNIKELNQKIARFPRKNLIHLPTPLRKLDKLSAELGGPEIWVKRDDLTGLAFGGNKSRKLEFIIADALAKNADTIITWASVQSNWCMQTAAAARRFGLRPVLILFHTSDLAPEMDGNLLLDHLLDADVRIKEAERGKIVSEEAVTAVVEEVVAEVRRQGRSPYVVSVGGSRSGYSMEEPLGTISYVQAFAEMTAQAEEAGFAPTHIIHATGSGGTQAGLLVGAKALGTDVEVVGISVSEEKEEFSEIILEICGAAENALNLSLGIKREDVIVRDEYIAEGYGIVDRAVAEAVRFLFIKEGIVLDPVYTGKAMVGLIDLAKKRSFRNDDRIVFFHTGGTPALFPYRQALVEKLRIPESSDLRPGERR